MLNRVQQAQLAKEARHLIHWRATFLVPTSSKRRWQWQCLFSQTARERCNLSSAPKRLSSAWLAPLRGIFCPKMIYRLGQRFIDQFSPSDHLHACKNWTSCHTTFLTTCRSWELPSIYQDASKGWNGKSLSWCFLLQDPLQSFPDPESDAVKTRDEGGGIFATIIFNGVADEQTSQAKTQWAPTIFACR